jgi:hypothetical protein
MPTQFRFKTQSQVTEFDRGDYLALIDGDVPEDGVPLVHSREVKLEPLKRQQTRDAVYSSEESTHNRPSARRNVKTGRTLEKGIHLYRLWFRFLKLALELEQMKVDLVVKNHTWITNKVDVPRDVLEQSARERRERFARSGKTAGHFTGDSEKVFRCKVVQKVRVSRDAYRGWDLDQVLTQTFDKWWVTHSHLFEGRLPAFVVSKRDWIDHPDHLYIRIDKTAQWRDVAEFLRTEVSKEMKGKRASFAISGKNPRVNVIQNNYNALVLLLKGWTPKQICTDREIYLRKTDELEPLSGKTPRTAGERLTVPTDKTGKLLYSTLVSKQREMGIWHLLEVCQGRFGIAKPTH